MTYRQNSNGYTLILCASRPTPGNVGSITIGSGRVENVGNAVVISALCHSIPEI
jgi:hypothetical protein